jgi:alkyl hydroperoxide reductase subunit AhpC
LAKFKESLKAQFPFVPDPEAKLTNLYEVKTPVLKLANRYTFVIGEGRKVLKVESGKDAIDPNGAIVACPLRKPKAAREADAVVEEAGKDQAAETEKKAK